MPAIVIVFPRGVPVCLKPVTQQSPGVPARTGEVEVMICVMLFVGRDEMKWISI